MAETGRSYLEGSLRISEVETAVDLIRVKVLELYDYDMTQVLEKQAGASHACEQKLR